MSEIERRTGYQDGRVLLEADRLLDPQFSPMAVYLSGSMVEMLRNVTEYLNRRTTFVDEYRTGYYLTVTDEDYLVISTIVANLEELLMGNDNTVWAYNDRLLTMETHTMLADGGWTQIHPTVPEGEVWVVEGISLGTNQTGSLVNVLNYILATNYAITELITPLANAWAVRTDFRITLKEDDGIQFVWANVVTGQTLTTYVFGYKMKVDG